MSKKKLVSLAIVVIMVAILSYSTLAWFQDQDKVTNTFTVDDSLTSFNVDVWEEVPDGTDTDDLPDKIGVGTKEDLGTTFEKIVPDEQYLKTVHVENTSGNVLAGQYIKVEVTFINYDALKKMGATDEDYDCTGMLLGDKFSTNPADTSDWWYDANATKISDDGETATYTFYLKEVLESDTEKVLFTHVQLPATMDFDDAKALGKDSFKIQVVAYAIQSTNIDKPNASGSETSLDKAVYAFTQWQAPSTGGESEKT